MKEFKKWLESPLGKAVLEALRWGICAVVSRLLLLLPQLNQTTDVATLTIILRFVDAALHKSGVAEKGILRF